MKSSLKDPTILEHLNTSTNAEAPWRIDDLIGLNANKVSENLEYVPEAFRVLMGLIEWSDLEITTEDINTYNAYYEAWKDLPGDLQEKMTGGIITTHNNKILNLTQLKSLLNWEKFSTELAGQVKILCPLELRVGADYILDIRSDSIVYTDLQQQKVFKVYVRDSLNPEDIRQYYDIQNMCRDAHTFELDANSRSKIQWINKVSISIDTSHEFIQWGKYFPYGMQDFVQWDTLYDTEFKELYSTIQDELNNWIKDQHGISRSSDSVYINMKVTKQEWDTLHLVVTDLWTVIKSFLKENTPR